MGSASAMFDHKMTNLLAFAIFCTQQGLEGTERDLVRYNGLQSSTNTDTTALRFERVG